MNRLILLATLICGCHTTVNLNHKYHIDTHKPVYNFLEEENIKKIRKTPFMLYYELLDSTQRRRVMDSLKNEEDSVEYVATHREV